ncbi:type II secretion system GspH family protein [Sporosarcina sp. ACRSL]|uniref:PulJ/GspJ family protein n=1 Tax=Sporosarcina sp. ACRSL TaxID=2918215 RepID=UPI001EF57CD3|nr:type II secretion system protein [Sporosarcina sp. ACRSL]MCG7344998.1 type II secretion system GspH family protein [Sporosarcina sp. ACRSL]
MRSQKLNERGMTLVEILAALVILGIVFVGFMTVFPQMTNFNEKTESKLSAMNEVRVLLDNYRNSSYSLNDFTSENGYIEKNEAWIRTEKSELGEVKYRVEKQAALPAGDSEGELSLHEINISIQKDSKVISETFGYIEVGK